MAEAKVKIRIGSEAQLSGFDKLKNALATAGSKVKSWAKGIGSNLMNIKAGFDMLKGAISSIGGLFKKALDAESMTVQFKTLMGSMDSAKEHMEMLRELGSTPPFSLEQFAEASRAMMTLSDGVLGTRSSLELVGDAAAATGKPIEQVGEAVAKAYAMIRDGQPVSRAAAQLRNLGLITPEVAASLTDMQKAGASGVEIWDTLQRSLEKYKGAMEETEETGNGMIGAIQSQWDEGIRDFGDSLLDVGKVYIKQFLDWLKKIREDGSLKEFVDNFASFTKSILSGVEKCVSAFKTFKDWLVETFGAAGDVIGAMAGGASFSEAVDYAGEQMLQREKEKLMDEEEQKRLQSLAKVREAERKANQEREKEAEKQHARDEIARKDAERKAAAEAKAAEKAAKEKAKQEEQEAKKAKKAEEERKKRLKEEANQQIKFETQLHDAKMQAIEDEIKEEEKAKKTFDDKIKRGIAGEKSRRHDGRSRVKLDPDTGLPQSVADMQRAERFAKNGTKEQGKAARRAAADEKRASKLEQQLARGGKISKGDQKFLDSLKELNKRRKADKHMKELNEQKDQAVLDIKKTVDDIKLGLEQNLKVK